MTFFRSVHMHCTYSSCNICNMAQSDVATLERRSGTLLSYERFLFARNIQRVNKVYWRCAEKSCGVFMHTNVIPNIPASCATVLREPSNHLHPPCDSSIQHREMLLQMTDVVQADPCAPVHAAYDNVTANTCHEDAVLAFHVVATILRRKRSICFPPVPRHWHCYSTRNVSINNFSSLAVFLYILGLSGTKIAVMRELPLENVEDEVINQYPRVSLGLVSSSHMQTKADGWKTLAEVLFPSWNNLPARANCLSFHEETCRCHLQCTIKTYIQLRSLNGKIIQFDDLQVNPVASAWHTGTSG